MTDEELKQMADDLTTLKNMLPMVAPVAQVVQEIVVPAIQTVVPVLKDVVAPALLSVDERLNLLMKTYEALASEVNAIKSEVAKIVSLLLPG